MSAKKKHNTADQYLQYLKGELSHRERHAFEQGLEADPFEKEALEGLETLTPDQATEDILSLHGQLNKRLARRRRITFYSVAASVASLLIIGTVFLQIYDFNPGSGDEITEQELPVSSSEKPLEVTTETADVFPEEEPAATPVSPSPDHEKKSERSTKGTSAKSEQVARVPAPQEARNVEPEIVFLSDEDDLEDLQVAEMAGMEPLEEELVVMEAEAQMDQSPAAPARMAKRSKSTQNEVPAGYAEETDFDTALSHTPAEPLVGYEAFKTYIKDHIRVPDTETGSTHEVVILDFTVTVGGEITDFKPIRSPGEVFTEEAIRLIKEGPSWSPATNALGATEEVVRLRIVFHR